MKILLLAGTGEARRLAEGLLAQNHDVVASLSGATRAPADLGCETRVGGFGGDAGFEAWLMEHKPDLVLDATHPFADEISLRTHRICGEHGIRYLQLLRDAWVPETGDRWFFIDKPEEAAKIISPDEVVFLATGRQTLQGFNNLKAKRMICRQIDPPDGDFPFPNGDYLVGRPPFSIEDEEELFKKLRVDWLVVKNAGGHAPRSKLDAARNLGMRVLMIHRPKQPEGEKVKTVAEALDWVVECGS